jgi:hypothetical protein
MRAQKVIAALTVRLSSSETPTMLQLTRALFVDAQRRLPKDSPVTLHHGCHG